MTKKDFLSGAYFKVKDHESILFTNWTYYYHGGTIMAKDASAEISLHSFILGMDAKYVYLCFYLLGQEVKVRIPFNTLELI